MNSEKHICCGCGQEAFYQMKNGKWYCTKNARSCPGVKQKVKNKAILIWNKLKENGIHNRKDIPIQQRVLDLNKGQEHICFYCGKPGQYQMKNGRWCCCQSFSSCPAIREKNSKKQKERYKNGTTVCNLKEYAKKGQVPWNKGLTKETSSSMKQISQTLKAEYKSGNLKVKKYNHTKETKQYLSKLRSQQIANGVHGGFNDIKWYHIKNLKGVQCCVRGNWQLWTAQYLNTNNINWQRNKYLFYMKEDQIVRTYNPDFYLPDLNLYLEVKGYFSQLDKEKMQCVLTQNEIKILWIDITNITKIKNNTILFEQIPIYNNY